MIRIPVMALPVTETDETGVQATRNVLFPATPIPATAVRVECDGEFYTVYEQGDV